MANFFSAIQNKFKAGFHGRYVAHVIEQIAEFHPQIVLPLLLAARNAGKADLSFKPSKTKLLSSIESVTTEVDFLNRKLNDENDRRADMEIMVSIDGKQARVLIEIKMFDSFLDNQLKDYIDWANSSNEVDGYRRVVVLTAYPLSKDEMNLIADANRICHMYLSDLVERLDDGIDSELVALFKKYMYEEGYAMYKLEADSDDYKAFLSFMVLAFLPHLSGKGRVVSGKKIAGGPVVFANLVQNWQLISERLSSALGFKQMPTVRYFPEQCSSETNAVQLSTEDGIFLKRRGVRKSKTGGRYWLTAEKVFPDSTNLRVEWGQVIQISDSEDGIKCGLYAFVRRGLQELSYEGIEWLNGGITDSLLYSPELLLRRIQSLVDGVVSKAKLTDPSLPTNFASLEVYAPTVRENVC